MKKIKSSYELSLKSDKDIDDIINYTIKNFGANQAIKYTSVLKSLFEHLLFNPYLGKERIEIKNTAFHPRNIWDPS